MGGLLHNLLHPHKVPTNFILKMIFKNSNLHYLNSKQVNCKNINPKLWYMFGGVTMLIQAQFQF